MNARTFPRPVLLIMMASAAAIAFALAPALITAAREADRPVLWWTIRASGFVAYAALTASMLFGLMISSRGLDGGVQRKTVLELHQQWTLSAVVATVVHITATVVDDYAAIDTIGALVPLASETLRGPVALGTVAFWGLAVLAVSSWMRSRLSFAVWRVVHAAALGTFLVALAHGLLAGVDSQWTAVQVLYLSTGVVVFGSTVFRLLYSVRAARAARAQTQAASD